MCATTPGTGSSAVAGLRRWPASMFYAMPPPPPAKRRGPPARPTWRHRPGEGCKVWALRVSCPQAGGFRCARTIALVGVRQSPCCITDRASTCVARPSVEHWNAECVGWHACARPLRPAEPGACRARMLDRVARLGLRIQTADHFTNQRWHPNPPSYAFCRRAPDRGSIAAEGTDHHGRIYRNIAAGDAVSDFVNSSNAPVRRKGLLSSGVHSRCSPHGRQGAACQGGRVACNTVGVSFIRPPVITPCPFSVLLSNQGSFPPPALPGICGNTSPSATLPARPAPHGVPVGVCAPPTGLPVLLPSPSSMRAAATTPAEPADARVARFPAGGSLPRQKGGSASALLVSGPAQRSLALQPAWSLSRPRRPGPIQEKWRRPTPFALLLPRI